MKPAAILLLVGVTLASVAWFLSGSGSGASTVQRAAFAPRLAPGPEGQTTSLGDQSGGIRLTAAEEIPSAAAGASDLSRPTAPPAMSGALGPGTIPSGGQIPQAEDFDTFENSAIPLPSTPATGSRVTGMAASATGSDSRPQPLIPATPAAESPVSPPLAVPAGARLPALFLDERPLPPPQRRVLDRVANEFIDAVAGDPSGQNRALWESAREAADQQYIKLYGHAAYNALHLRAAKEAVREQRATATPTAP